MLGTALPLPPTPTPVLSVSPDSPQATLHSAIRTVGTATRLVLLLIICISPLYRYSERRTDHRFDLSPPGWRPTPPFGSTSPLSWSSKRIFELGAAASARGENLQTRPHLPPERPAGALRQLAERAGSRLRWSRRPTNGFFEYLADLSSSAPGAAPAAPGLSASMVQAALVATLGCPVCQAPEAALPKLRNGTWPLLTSERFRRRPRPSRMDRAERPDKQASPGHSQRTTDPQMAPSER